MQKPSKQGTGPVKRDALPKVSKPGAREAQVARRSGASRSRGTAELEEAGLTKPAWSKAAPGLVPPEEPLPGSVEGVPAAGGFVVAGGLEAPAPPAEFAPPAPALAEAPDEAPEPPQLPPARAQRTSDASAARDMLASGSAWLQREDAHAGGLARPRCAGAPCDRALDSWLFRLTT
ncbi:MAG TPA: hypothetical protein VF400_00245, partial [Anaeromyxobacteraceae bacterium]